MIWIYLRYAFRNLAKQRGRTLINVLGLSFGIACVVIIYLYARRELGYDDFHANRDRIYRVYCSRNQLGDPVNSAFMPGEMASAIADKIPGVDKTCRLRSMGAWIGIGEVLFNEHLGFTDTTYLEMFSFPVLAGDPVNPLAHPQSVVLTETVAGKFFGDSITDWNDIIGQSIEFPQEPPNVFTITAVISDPPDNNSFRWTVLIPYQNARYYPQCNDPIGNTSVFVMLDRENDPQKVETSMQSLIEELHGERIEQFIHFSGTTREELKFGYHLQPLKDLYLNKLGMGYCYEKTGSTRSIFILTSIAVLILLIACFNFVMLSIGSSMNRLRDFGLMNVSGAYRRQIMGHFISESFLLTLTSMFLGILLAEQILPLFNKLARDDLQFNLFDDWRNFIFLLLLILAIVFSTSSYIGVYLLRKQQPIRFLRKEMQLMRSNRAARGFVILQYLITIVLLMSGGVILKQLNYMIRQDVGFVKENLLVLPVDFPMQKVLTLKDRLLQSPHVLKVSMSDRNFITGSSSTAEKNEMGEIITIRFLRIDQDYIPTIGLELVEGRNFYPDEPMDENHNVIVNEELVKEYGIENPVGYQIKLVSFDLTLTIIGVVRDFHFDSMHDEIMPLIMAIFPFNGIWTVFARIDEDYSAAIKQVRQAWDEVVPEYTFEYHFMADNLVTQYENEDRWSRIIAYAAGIAIFLSCLGLNGISGLLVARRIKEIGIRKSHGASVSQVLIRLNADILKWVLLSFLMACPAAWFIMMRWLRNFAYHTTFSWWIFLLAGIIALLVSMLTVSLQIYRAALQNPVDILRYE